jgi:hypothetical protein
LEADGLADRAGRHAGAQVVIGFVHHRDVSRWVITVSLSHVAARIRDAGDIPVGVLLDVIGAGGTGGSGLANQLIGTEGPPDELAGGGAVLLLLDQLTARTGSGVTADRY